MNTKTALITGASSGIGEALAKLHASRNGSLILVARRLEKLESLKAKLEKEHEISVHVIVKDLTDPLAPQQIFEEIENEGLTVDYLINNAGFGGLGKFQERPLEDELGMIQLNMVSLTALCRLFLPVFLKRGSGRIMNVSSTASLSPGGPLQAVYFATKHYVTALSYGIAGELDDTEVTITALLPGATQTEFADEAGMRDSELFQNAFPASLVAADGYAGMEAGRLEVVSGLTLSQKILVCIAPFLPKRLILKEIRKMQEV